MTEDEHISKSYRMNTLGGTMVEDDFFDKEVAYDAWQEKEMTAGSGFFRRYWLWLLVVLIFGLLLVYLFYHALRPKNDPIKLSQASIIDSRVNDLELRLSRLEEQVSQVSSPTVDDSSMEAFERLAGRMDRLENAVKTQLDEMTAKNNVAPPKKVAQKPIAKTAPEKQAPPVKKEVIKKPQKEKQPPTINTQARYHTVQPNETLYRISLKYGISVDRLKELNQITGNTIKAGQKLRVSP